MSALALLCLNRGWKVGGSTLGHNENTSALTAQGAEIFLNHAAENLGESTECVVYSSAIAESNPEIQAARLRNIPILHRSTLLRAFVHPLRTIGVSGTHGKTTTTSLLGHTIYAAHHQPLILSGGIMTHWNSPIYPGKGTIAVVEADESDHSHVNFSSLEGAILTNIEGDHMENYGGSLDNVWASFQRFLQLSRHFASVCGDAIAPKNPWLQNVSCPITFYGTGSNADFCAENIRTTETGMRFDCLTPAGKWTDVSLNLWGHHNVLNALAVLSTCTHLHLSEDQIRFGLSTFSGVARRLTHVGNRGNVPIIDDYAHHPTEITAVLKTLNDRGFRRILAICQPHRYTRLRDCMELFSRCFQHADKIVLLPVYSAGEEVISDAESVDLAKKLTDLHHSVAMVPSWPQCTTDIGRLIDGGSYDVVVCMGAGDVTHLAKDLIETPLGNSSNE